MRAQSTGVVNIGGRIVGPGQPPYVVAEIGINHNGDLNLALQLVNIAKQVGADAVKFQKRTVDVVYSPEELMRPRESRYGTTNSDLKYGLEFGSLEYDAIDAQCHRLKLDWTASCWDTASVDFIDAYDPPFYKIASPCLTDHGLLRHTRSKGKPIVLSTGMSSLDQIEAAVEVLGRDQLVLLHCVSAYPARYCDLNLRFMGTLEMHYGVPAGYSSHEPGAAGCIAAAALGACMVEKHFTTSRSLWGSDQGWSSESREFRSVVEGVAIAHSALGSFSKPGILEDERAALKKLRRVQ